MVTSGVREQLAKKKKVAINKSYYFIVGKDAMGCKTKKRKADPPFSKAYAHQRLQRNLYLLVFFFQKLLMGARR